jgi:selenide, water dikinase
MIQRLKRRHLVLLGIGHTNAHVLRMWKMQPFPDTDLTCISDHSIATYSGMMPAVLARQIPQERMEIDLVRLCAFAGAKLLTGQVVGIEHARCEVLMEKHPPVPFDALSIGIGSVAATAEVTIDSEAVVMIKPMQSFLSRLEKAVALVRSQRQDIRVAIVGSGVAGVEITCCLPAALKQATNGQVSLTLVTRSDQILPEVSGKTRQFVERELQSRGVKVLTSRSVTSVTADRMTFQDGDSIETGLVIWATNASPPPLLSKLGLKLDERGFLATNDRLQTSAANIFAVGDTGTITSERLPKAGVYAVRQGPVLWENLRRSLSQETLQRYAPQRSFLKLINLGDGRAVGQWKGFTLSGRWAMRLKNSIDSRFMDMYQVNAEMVGTMAEATMQCRGCGCKLGADDLESALSDSPVVLEDAAAIGGDHSPYLASTDFFSSPFEDAYLAGRVAALHSASDIVACGAEVMEALANVVVPEGDPRSQQRTLHDFLAGARLEFAAMGASVVGGHTIVGPRMEVGFTVIGRRLGKLLQKGNLRPGDRLFITKPIGIGVLLAAHMRSLCPARAYESLIEAMLQRQHQLAKISLDAGIAAGTDITGFGLGGHLVEMLRASHVAATLRLQALPILPGAIELVEQGIQSSLAPENRKIERRIIAASQLHEQARYKLLFDPQTCGGMLLGVPNSAVNLFVQAMTAAGFNEPAEIGVVDETSDQPSLKVIES